MLSNYRVKRLLNHEKTPAFHKLDNKLLQMIEKANGHYLGDLGFSGHNYILPVQYNISKKVNKILCDFSTNNYIVFNSNLEPQEFNAIVSHVRNLFSDKYAPKVIRLVYFHSLGLINGYREGNKLNRVVRNLKTLSKLKLKSELKLFKYANIFYTTY